MEPIEGIGIFLFVVLALVTFMSILDHKNKERIEKEIQLVGGEPVEIAFQFVGYDRDNQHYNVRFADSLGRKHKTRCKVNIWTRGIYWRRTPAEILSDLPVEEVCWERLGADNAGSKEQIINDLVAENERLREQLVLAGQIEGSIK